MRGAGEEGGWLMERKIESEGGEGEGEGEAVRRLSDHSSV